MPKIGIVHVSALLLYCLKWPNPSTSMYTNYFDVHVYKTKIFIRKFKFDPNSAKIEKAKHNSCFSLHKNVFCMMPLLTSVSTVPKV